MIQKASGNEAIVTRFVTDGRFFHFVDVTDDQIHFHRLYDAIIL
jgi:hypothetical protein